MKKVLYCTLAAAGVMSLASCSNDDMPMPAGDGVSITVKLPRDMATRGTFGDGTDTGDRAVLDNLQWSVFEVAADGTPTLVFSDGRSAFGTSQTEELVNIPLAKGKTYQVAFYADDKDNTFVTYKDGNISVDYKNAKSNTAAEDAFIGKSKVFTVSGAYSETVTLTRPFAQLNWGTDDTKAKVLEKIIGSLTAEVSVTQGLYTGMNVLTGDMVGEPVKTAVKFGTVEFSALPKQTFPVQKTEEGAEPYALIAMDYLLTGNGTVDCELSFNNGLSPVTVNAAPVQVNHRTNIYGSLLTAPGEFNIIVDNNFQDPDLSPLVWDGTVTEPIIDEAAKTVTLTTAGHLAGLAKLVNDGNLLEGYTVTLENDIDLAGIDWTPIGKGKAGDSNAGFKGNFDGKGHTISNLKIENNESTPAAFFAMAHGEIKNVNFKSPVVTGVHYTAVVVGYTRSDVKIEGVNISGATIVNNMLNNDDGDKVGAIIGFSNSTDSSISNCQVTNSTITGVRDMGAVAGLMNGGISNCTVANVTVTQSGDYEDPSPYVGLLYGRRLAGTTNSENIGAFDTSNKISNVQIKGLPEDVLVITNRKELTAFANSVNKDLVTYAGKKVFLAADIDLGNSEWTPIGLMNESNKGTGNSKAPRFQGEFYGNGHIVKNFTINQSGNYSVAGFFGRVSGNVVINQLGLFNFTINTNHYAGGLVAYIYNNGLNGTNVSILNNSICNGTITSTPNMQSNGSYDNGDKVGGVVGYGNVGKGGSIYITNNILSGMKLTAFRDLGGLIGYAENSNLKADNNFGNFSGNGNVFNVASGNIVLVQDLTKSYPVSGRDVKESVHNTYGYISNWKINLFNATNSNAVEIQRIGE